MSRPQSLGSSGSFENSLVNGPINTVRLEGTINNNPKIIYLFMDMHMNVQLQTECDNIRSIDIDKFLVNTFDTLYEKNPEKKYDLFVELNPLYYTRFGTGRSIQKGRYLFDQVAKMFNKSVNIKDEKMYQSEELKNVRLHYADIREYTTRRYDNIMNGIYNIISSIQNNGYLVCRDIANLLDGMKLIHSNMMFLYNLIYSNKDIKPQKSPIIFTENQNILMSYTDKDYQLIAQKIIYKILTKYTNPNVKKIINDYISTEMHDEFKKMFAEFDTKYQYVDELFKKIKPYEFQNIGTILMKHKDGRYTYGLNMNDIIYELTKLEEFLWAFLVATIGLQLMDLYVLRRILDKDYVGNAIAYTGAAHSMNYIRILLKYFGFHITNWSYIKYDIEQSEQIIKNSEKMEDLQELFFPPVLVQCSDLEGFPKL